MKRGIGVFAIISTAALLLLIGSASAAWASQTKEDVVKRLQRASEVMTAIQKTPDKGIPSEVHRGGAQHGEGWAGYWWAARQRGCYLPDGEWLERSLAVHDQRCKPWIPDWRSSRGSDFGDYQRERHAQPPEQQV